VPGRRRRLWAVLALPLLGVTAYAGWLALHGDSAPAAPRSEARAPSVPAVSATPEAPRDTPSPGSSTVARPAAVEPAPVAPPAPPVVETIHLHLVTTPGGAIVELDGKRLGATPLDTDVTRLDGEAQLVVSHDGFTDVKQRLDLRSDQSLSLALPAVPRPRVIKRPAPPPAERRDARAGSAAPRNAGSAAPQPKGDPNLDIRLSR
jgi:hypothetical protein